DDDSVDRPGMGARLGLTVLLLAVVVAGAWVLRSWSILAVPGEPSGAPVPITATPVPAGTTTPPPRPRSPADQEGGAHRAPARSAAAAPARRAVQSVLRARARAWESGALADLERATVKGSAAWRADAGDLAQVGKSAIDFERVRFRVLDTTVVSGDPTAAGQQSAGRMVVRATVRREPVIVRTAEGERRRYPRSTETVLLMMRRGERGWRLYDWD
ncbi:MAG: hypothetical protein WA892_01470, partial [Ornithinimicrobium sp.]